MDRPRPGFHNVCGGYRNRDEFGLRIYTEAWRRGWEWAVVKVVIGDGALWIWNLAELHFSGTVQIVDLYHARQHLWDAAALLYPYDAGAKKLRVVPMKDLPDHGRIEPLVEWLREIAAELPALNPAWPTPSLPCVAADSIRDLRTSGGNPRRLIRRHTHFYVVHP